MGIRMRRRGKTLPIGARRRRGMTLIEVMMAVAILSIGVFALVDAAARCLAVVRQARNFHLARMVLDQAELEYPVVKEEGEFLNVDVEAADYPGGFTFRRASEETEEKGLLILRSTVSWAEKGRNSREEVVTYLFATNKFL
jgi:prepilin-type N-terminal cleavage/methylation domain-containing protein